MPRALRAAFASRLDYPDLRWMPDEGFSIGRIRIELLSGLTVALALVPEAVAFAFVAGVHPLVGLYAAFLVGLITALIGQIHQAGAASGDAGVCERSGDRDFSGPDGSIQSAGFNGKHWPRHERW